MNWQKSGYGATILDVVSEKELLYPVQVAPASIENMELAAALVKEAIRDGLPISIMGDYDVDGITSTAILWHLIRSFGRQTPTVRLPKRLSEGYGLSIDAFDDFNQGLLITVDNGIAATEEITYAKELGFTVLVIDHHLPGAYLPEADVIVDPHIRPDNSAFVNYCGAGLALKLAELMLNESSPAASDLLDRLTVLAALGTIADVMPLVGDNRRIVKRGLQLMKSGRTSGLQGLAMLIEEAGVYSKDEADIAFKIAPILNAPGRLIDNGAEKSLALFLTEPDCEEDKHTLRELAKELILINEERKTAVNEAMEQATEIIQEECAFGNTPLCLCLEDVKEGVVGIVAGKLAEAYRTPAFVFTGSSEPGILKGSGRSYGGVNLKELVDAAARFIIRSGGHEGAAGITVASDKFSDMLSAMETHMRDVKLIEPDVIEYDLEISPEKVRDACSALALYAPYGEGNRAPVFCIKDATLVSRYGNHYKPMGKNGEHLKLFCNGFSIVCFNGTQKHLNLGKPTRIDIVGTISENKFQYASECQVEVKDFRASEKDVKSTALLEALRRNGTI